MWCGKTRTSTSTQISRSAGHKELEYKSTVKRVDYIIKVNTPVGNILEQLATFDVAHDSKYIPSHQKI